MIGKNRNLISLFRNLAQKSQTRSDFDGNGKENSLLFSAYLIIN